MYKFNDPKHDADSWWTLFEMNQQSEVVNCYGLILIVNGRKILFIYSYLKAWTVEKDTMS